MRLTLLFLLIGFSVASISQEVITRDFIIQKIHELQIEQDEFYDQGLFSSQRNWALDFGAVEDNNIFSTSSLVYILRGIVEKSPDARINKIIKKALPNFEKYRSRNGRPAYNHWQTISPDLPFPNSSILSRKQFRLPDDYDDTALIQLAKGPNDLDAEVREEMIRYATRTNRERITSFPSAYRSFNAYEVWYADKMEQEYDLVVMTNILLFSFEKGFGLVDSDLETIKLIKAVLEDKAHLNQPEKISPYYRSATIIVYHLARLIQASPEGIFMDQSDDLVADIRLLLNDTDSEMEKVLLSTSLARLGSNQPVTLNREQLLKEASSFPFFSYQPKSGLLQFLPKMTWSSEAVSWGFVLECLTYSEEQISWKVN